MIESGEPHGKADKNPADASGHPTSWQRGTIVPCWSEETWMCSSATE